MKHLIISELEKKSILKKHNLLLESGEIKSLPSDIQTALKKLGEKINREITDSDVKKELNQEGDWRKDNGGEDSKARKQIEKLLSDLKSEFSNVNTKIVSGYRSYNDQVKNFGGKVNGGRSFDNVQKAVTLPGFSQHHTGKAFDIISVEESWWESNPKVEEWVKNNCGKFGFEISYPNNGILREKEPWHLFYVGGESDTDSEKKTITKSEIDQYYKSTTVDPKLEKTTEKIFRKSGCKPVNQYTEAPSIDDIKNSSDKIIRIGHTGEAVKLIQSFLSKLGFDIGKCGEDGLFGPKTKKALEDFQESLGLAVSSSVDTKTLEKLTGKSNTDSKTDSKTAKSSTGKSSSTNDKEYVIIKSDNYKGKNVHVLFGGMHTNPSYSRTGYDTSNMEKYVPFLKPYSSNAVIIITHHMNTLGNVKKYLDENMKGYSVTSIAGFSQGGKETWKHADDSSLRLVGLIDPSTYDTNETFGANTYLVCNPSNWGSSGFVGQTKQRLKWYCNHKDDSKYAGHIDCVNERHSYSGIVDYFYKKYGSRI